MIMIDLPIKDRNVVIVGAGHVGEALYKEFHFIGWHESVVDNRASLLTEESFPYAERIISPSILGELAGILGNSITEMKALKK